MKQSIGKRFVRHFMCGPFFVPLRLVEYILGFSFIDNNCVLAELAQFYGEFRKLLKQSTGEIRKCIRRIM